MTYLEIAKRKKHFHNTGISLHFIYATIRPPKHTPTPQPSEVQPGHCMNAHQNADGAHQNLGSVSWSVNGIVWSVGKTIFDNSSVLVIWFSLGPFLRVLPDFLHVFSPKSTNCISFRRIQSVQSTCPPWWGNSHISPDKRVWKLSDLNLADPENCNPWIFDTIQDVMFAVHTKCQLHRSHQKRCVDLKTPNACLESLALVSAHVELLSLRLQQWFCPSHNFWFAIWQMCLPSSSAETSHGQCHACHARRDAERGPLKGRSGLPFNGMERLFSPILPMQRKLGENETEMWLEHAETSANWV